MTRPLGDLTLLHGDCVERMRELPESSVDSVVCDPPYELGFMGRSWDSAGVSFNPDTWREALRVLKPGGHLLAFGGTRTSHRIACAIEDAGFEIRDVLSWLFGSGFPKSMDVAKAIDSSLGAEGGWRQEDHPGRAGSRTNRDRPGVDIGQTRHASEDNPDGLRHVYEPATDEARQWQGWGTALKPAYEPIVVARKPLAGTVAANVLEHSTGALNIDGCRVEFAGAADEAESKDKNRHADFGTQHGGNAVYGDYSMLGDRDNCDPPGRWPANVVLTHSDECELVGTREVRGDGNTTGVTARERGDDFSGYEGGWDDSRPGSPSVPKLETVELWECADDCPVRLLDEQSGISRSSGTAGGRAVGKATDVYEQGWSGAIEAGTQIGLGDVGGASRFFYCAKTSRAERNAGLDDFEKKPLLWSSGEQSPGTFQAEGTEKAARNPHPTVKPINLMRWLIRLATPPGGTVLDPFLGSGTTGCAAALEGVSFVGVELDPDYFEIAKARIAFWREHGEHGLDVVRARDKSLRERQAIAGAGQLDLLGDAA